MITEMDILKNFLYENLTSDFPVWRHTINRTQANYSKSENAIDVKEETLSNYETNN